MMTLTLFKHEFRCSLWNLGLYVLLTSLLCSLGFWQLDRAEKKRAYLQQQQRAAEAPALELNANRKIDSESSQYQKLTATGHYDTAHQFLIDNQIQDGKPGYFVLTPFLVDMENRAVLVNRGWVALGPDRRVLPNVAINSDVQKVHGRINHFPSVGMHLKGAEIPTDSWPSVVQVVDSKLLAAKLGYELYDFQIELDVDEPEGYLRQWKTVSPIPPEKHLAYAVQWFGLALTLTGLFIWISSRKRGEQSA